MKTKLFSLAVVFAAMTLVACGGKGGESKAANTSKAASAQSAKPSSKGPVWGEWKVTKPATCAEEGKEERTNDQGGHEERKIEKLKQHTWTATNVDASGEGVAYEDIECSVCHAKGLRVAANKGTINGEDKGGAPEGCIKLKEKNQSIEVKINIPAAKTGKIYLTGVMDYWYDGSNNNQNKSFSSVKDESNTANFKLEVNEAEIDMTANLTTTFGEIFPEEAGETVGSVTYSQMGDAEVGAVSLQQGLNTIKFTRVDSYNMAVKYFTVVFAA